LGLGTWGLGLKRPRLILLTWAVVLVTTAVVLAVSGGFRTTVGGFRISAQSPLAAAIAALIAGGAWIALARRDRAIAADLEASWRAVERNASRLIGAVALIAAIVAATFATRSAAGADASGYLSQARIWTLGQPPVYVESLARGAHELDGWVTTPLGWRPHADRCDFDCEGIQVPTYPPGLPLLMAVPHAYAGINGATAVVTAAAAVATWATGMIAGGVAGILAAALLAFSPVFLYQSFQPMSDVPVTAAWMLCFLLVRQQSMWAGMACAMAVLIRPNLAPLALIPLVVTNRRMAFAIPVGLAALFLAFVQSYWYGSPLRSGYGTADELFALANIGPNAIRYLRFLIATAPVLLFALFGFWRTSQAPSRKPQALGVFAVFVIASYLVYAVFDDWSYLRFLLPAMAVFAIFAAIDLMAWIDRSPAAARLPMLLVLLLGVTAYSLFVARSFDAFRLADQLRRVEQTARFIQAYGADRPVVISGEQSGAIRYYTLMPIVRWEAATPDVLQAAITAIERSGRSTYIALDAWENELFLEKFATVPEVQLDWPPMLDAGTTHRTRVWRISDRARFLEGTQPPTVRLP
jgi:hypothetical protein